MSEHPGGYEDAGADDQDPGMSLWSYFETLRRYRRVIGATIVCAVVAFLVGVAALLALFPAERVATLDFRLLFDGAATNRYPTGAPFSPNEIVGAPVLTEVFKANDLQRYEKFEVFKEALFIQQSNRELDLLAYEYQAKLADTRLSSVDRARIETEFNNKRAALTDPSFSLTLRRTERFKSIPRDLMQKVLRDTLAAWAIQADRMGAMKYQVPILSSKVLSKQALEDEDYLIAADLLRAKALRIIETIAELQKIPTALTTRTLKDGITLPEIRANIEDALRFELEPLLGIIRSEGITKNARLLTLYASNQLFQLRLEKQAAAGRSAALRDALQDYQRTSRGGTDSRVGTAGAARQPGADAGSVSPQLSESFLDRLVEMSAGTQKADIEYRQNLTNQIIGETTRVAALERELAYYEDLVGSVKNVGSRPTGTPELIAVIKARSQKAFSAISTATDQLADLYKELSARNLDPVARLYAVTGPYMERTRFSLSFRSVALSFVVAMALVFLLVCAGCLAHNAMWNRPIA